jgi:hypothetical protein
MKEATFHQDPSLTIFHVTSQEKIVNYKRSSLFRGSVCDGSIKVYDPDTKITLMSPEVFEVKPKIKEEPRDGQENQNLLSTSNR